MRNVYYYPQQTYTKEEAIEIITRFLLRKLEKFLEFGMKLIVIAMIIALYKGDIVAREAEEVLARCDSYDSLHGERLSVEEIMWHYIDGLEVPKVEFETQKAEIVEVSCESAFLDYTQEDVELLAQLMYAEEGIFFKQYTENPETVERVHKLAGSVVINRASIGYRGEYTIEGTIYSKGQYAQQTLDRVTEGQDIPEIVYTWAEELLSEGALGPKGLIYQAEFEQGDETYDEIGNQYFCVETKYN